MSEDLSKMSNEELVKLYYESKAKSVVFNLSQQAKKILLNSCYGAIGNAYFLHNDVRIARAITLAGQAMINKSANETNAWLNNVLKNKKAEDYRVYSDTDSFDSSTMLHINNKSLPASEFFEASDGNVECASTGKYIKKMASDYFIDTYRNNHIEKTKVIYAMKHKVKKRMYKLKVEGNEIIVTEDHSIMFERNGNLIEGSVKDLRAGDKIIINDNNI